MDFSFGGGGRTTCLEGSLSSLSSCTRCFSTPVKACLLEGAGALAAGGGLAANSDMVGSEEDAVVEQHVTSLMYTVYLRSLSPALPYKESTFPRNR